MIRRKAGTKEGRKGKGWKIIKVMPEEKIKWDGNGMRYRYDEKSQY